MMYQCLLIIVLHLIPALSCAKCFPVVASQMGELMLSGILISDYHKWLFLIQNDGTFKTLLEGSQLTNSNDRLITILKNAAVFLTADGYQLIRIKE